MFKATLIAASLAVALGPVAAYAQCAGGYCGGYGYGRPGTYNYNVTGGYPGAGPYDSTIATSGIMAGASVLNNIISSVIAPPRPTVINNPPPVVIQNSTTMVGPGSTIVVPAPGATPGASRVIGNGLACGLAVLGYDNFGRPIATPVCQ